MSGCGGAGSVVDIELPYTPRHWAEPFHASFARWLVLVLHRRAGKTTAILNHHQRAATDDEWEIARLRHLKPDLSAKQLAPLLRNRVYGHVLPYRNQAKLVAWDMLKYYAADVPGAEPNEVELAIRYPNGNRLQLFGADNPDALRGPAFSGLSFDEYAQHPPNIFSEVLSKNLADHLGYAIFAGTIKGKNQLYKTHEAAKGDPKWFSLWQDIDRSLETEEDVTLALLEQAMDDDRDLIAKDLMSQAEFDQEWFLSPEAAIKGAIYGPLVATARKEKRIGRVPYDPQIPVDVGWDLGVGDSTALWFTQSDYTGAVRVIDYYENNGQGLSHYVAVLQQRGYVYGTHYMPHDVENQEWGNGKTRLEQARATVPGGIQVIPRLKLEDGIHAVRVLFPRCYFDEVKCEHGLETLSHYRWRENEKLHEMSSEPVHDWASHGADAFRYLALGHYTPKVEKRVNASRRDVDPTDARYGKVTKQQTGRGRGGW
jgi:phage terminase large subunit